MPQAINVLQMFVDAALEVNGKKLDAVSRETVIAKLGMDSVAIIAAASQGVDISFVMALQAARFLVVLLLGPAISRLVARAVRS